MASSPSPQVPAQLTIYNLPPSPPNFDRVGSFFIAFGSVWTLLVFAGMLFCVFNHNNPILKIRCLPLSFGAIFMLHCYWVLAQVTYSVGMTMPIVLAYDIQYFFMGIYYPLGMALFHASNLRFLHVARLQRQFAHSGPRAQEQECHKVKPLLRCRMRNWGYTARIMLWIGVGMIFQIFLTIAMWLACQKYHPTYGLPGTEVKGSTLPEQLADLGRGWEWWPSLLWQLIWTWIVNIYYSPSQWYVFKRRRPPSLILHSLSSLRSKMANAPTRIHLSIMVFEIFTVFVPAYLVIRSWALVRRVNNSNKRWETGSMTSSTSASSSTLAELTSFCSNSVSEKNKLDLLDEDLSDRLLTMTALDYVLRDNPIPLQDFSAMHDFSGENIAFLTRAARFKASWPVMPAGEQALDVYNEALGIYIDFVSTRDAEFPLNLSSRELKAQEAMFEQAARTVMGDSAAGTPATPFDVEAPSWDLPTPTESLVRVQQPYRGPVPEAFSLHIFARIESHIKYLVLTNTWPKFVSEMRQRAPRHSGESHCTDTTVGLSQQTLNSRLSRRLARLLRDLGL
ncbi:hypothetical protein E4U53_003541 [Claviceps sorghi]|nr:hypothetical protein E4U53_003541 [Claviceps sorghi]